MKKYYPKVGEHLFMHQRTGNSWVDMCRYPYTVVKVDKNRIWVQSCELVFNGPRYYDTLPDEIKENPYGEVRELKWSNSKRHTGWVYKNYPGDTYPSIACFGLGWDFQPYLN